MKLKKVIGKLLMAFLLISIGVAIGKEIAAHNAPTAAPPVVEPGKDKVVVYYMHTIPCVACIFIETTTKNLVNNEYADAVKDGTMEFISLNYLEPENTALAEKYNVGENMVIAVRYEDGRETSHVRLDKVMELASDADELAEYLRKGISSAVKGGGQ
jgi:hypothetical protein